MLFDACFHFRIERLGRRDIDGAARKAACAFFRMGALARSRSARDQDDGHKNLLSASTNHQTRPKTKPKSANRGLALRPSFAQQGRDRRRVWVLRVRWRWRW